MLYSRIVQASFGIACSLALAAEAGTAENNKFPPLLDATLEELRHGLDAGDFSSVDLTKAYIARINEVQNDLRAVNEINPDALAIAAELDAAREKNKGIHKLGPLHGIPILLKDIIATQDKMNNTAGSFALLGAEVPEDSTVVAKLRRAGAIILGKANLSQWANYRSLNGSSGWSAYGGQAVGAYFADQDPSGSSSGSAIASSIGLAWASLGTETDGSIMSPSHINNVVGIKPTVGLTSRYLVVPISEHQDTVGPLARTVKDAAYLLSAIAGEDKNDNYTSAIPFKCKFPDYVAACKKSGLKGRRIGVPRQMTTAFQDPACDPALAIFDSALDVLRSAGAIVVDNIKMPGLDHIFEKPYGDVVLGADYIADLPKEYLSKLKTNPNNITSVSDLQDFTRNLPSEDYPERDTGVWQEALDLGFDNTSPQFWGNYTEQIYYAGPQGLTGALKNHSLDAIVVPTPYSYFLSAVLGTPAISVPFGKAPADTKPQKNSFGNLYVTAPNQPFGLGFAGAKFSEEMLIGMAYAFEQRTNVRKQVHPHIQPKTELKDVVGRK